MKAGKPKFRPWMVVRYGAGGSKVTACAEDSVFGRWSLKHQGTLAKIEQRSLPRDEAISLATRLCRSTKGPRA